MIKKRPYKHDADKSQFEKEKSLRAFFLSIRGAEEKRPCGDRYAQEEEKLIQLGWIFEKGK